MKRLRGILGVFLIFFFGVIFGVAVTGGTIWKEMRDVIEGGPDAVVAKIADRLGKDLKLDDAQKKMLDQITTETRIALRGIRADAQPRVRETLAAAERKVRAVLGPEQQKKYDQIIEKSRDKWEDEPPAAPGTPTPAVP